MNRPLKKPPQLLHLEVGAFNSEHPIATDHLGDQHSRGCEFLHTCALRDVLIFRRWFVDVDINRFKISEDALYFGPHIMPIKSAISRAERRQSNRTNLVFLKDAPKIFQAFYDP